MSILFLACKRIEGQAALCFSGTMKKRARRLPRASRPAPTGDVRKERSASGRSDCAHSRRNCLEENERCRRGGKKKWEQSGQSARSLILYKPKANSRGLRPRRFCEKSSRRILQHPEVHNEPL